MSANEDGVEMVSYAAKPTQNLCPQVINADIIVTVDDSAHGAVSERENHIPEDVSKKVI